MNRHEQRRPSPVLAMALSTLMPGLGQIYAGERRRGITLILALQGVVALRYALVFVLGPTLPHVLVLAFPVTIPVLVVDRFLMGIPLVLETPLVPALSCLALALVIWCVGLRDTSEGVRTVGATAVPAWVLICAVALNLAALYLSTVIWQTVTWQAVSKAMTTPQVRVVRQVAADLLTPDFVVPRTAERSATGKFIVPGPGVPELPHREHTRREPRIALRPTKARQGESVTVLGTGFPPYGAGKLVLLGANEEVVAEFRTDAGGRFRTSFPNPRGIPGDYFVQAKTSVQTGGLRASDAFAEAGKRMGETIYLALIGTLLSLVLALPLSFFAARNLMSGASGLRLVYGLTRGLFSMLRSVEVLILAVIAVAVVGIGPTAGVIAIAIHGIGALGKLYSEAIESIEHGPIEAMRATGASELQVVIYGVVPQVVPQFIAFTLYRWDINVRMATVIGLVGGGGIGFQLIQYMSLMQWRQAATCIWLIAGVVMLMDYVSAVVREKIV